MPPAKKKREYYADWMRSTSVQLVIVVHSMWLAKDATGFLNAKDNMQYGTEIFQKCKGFIRTLVQVGIPIFFYISGMSTTYFNSQKPTNNFLVFFWSKFKRLMIPFFVAIPTILIPRLYFSQDYQESSCFTWENDVYGSKCIFQYNYFTYFKLALPTLFGNLSWLWYLPALFCDSLVNYPLLCWTQRRSRGIPIDWNVDWQYPAG